MKGIICEEVGRFAFREDLPEPQIREGEAIVRIRRIGICGTDLHAYRGNQPYFTYPRVLGHELAGTIEQIGDNREGLQAGDPVSVIPYMHCGHCRACLSGKTNCCQHMKVLGVHTDGGMRERIAVPISSLIKTEGLTMDQAAMLEPLAIGAHAVRRSGLGAGDRALIIGAGPIGLGVMAMASYAGAKVIAMDVNDERLDFCKGWAGAEHTVSALREPKKRLAELTDGSFPAFVIDATGNVSSMENAFGLVGHGGSLTYVGLVKSTITFNDPDFHAREMTLQGSRNATREDFGRVYAAITDGSIDIGRYITHRSALEDMIGQFDSWLKPESKVIKALVELD
ncbi:zinc-binding alcohol dehydrogenase family protein [Paenibacillus sp. alder61]|uniref:Zinc-binding alcohol dehydrogenase family protein n=1 Tax=Paenibacillus faecis TaxID=862114 RepID=A0A5D0D1K5_9BACL|nr:MULTISPECIES: zinc-binding alcohol dehydrogenase family protein [Paenibacillus]MCA1291398.1 zinc-binding alcohol dehydrogenase family protein [Paenibacillus sp. alder61]TYA14565.1 zinc-binding alcohol dehydrogenase family protein [Paenibacillus faecis]